MIVLGDDLNREGLIDILKRVVKMYEEVFEGMIYLNEEIVEMFGIIFEEEDCILENYKNMVVVKDILIYSYCEYYLVFMYNMKVIVIYKLKDKIIGFSKIVRIVDMVGRRF